METKRTIELTHEQIEILLHSLNVAEKEFSKNYQNILETINLPHNVSAFEHRKEIVWIDSYRDKILKLLQFIENGDLDV